MFIRDLQNNEYFLEGVVSHDQELNGDERIDIDIHYTDNNAEFLTKQDDLKMWTVLFENKEYKIISSKMSGKGDKYTVSVTAILYILDWLNSNRIYQRIDSSLTTTEAFNLVFDNSPFTYITVNSAPSESFEGLGNGETRLEVFKTLIDRYGYEMNIVGNVVYLQSQVGNDTNFEYRYKVNASNITKETNASDLWTYAKGYADYDDDEEETESKAKIIREYVSPLESVIGGRRHAPPVKDGRIKYASVLDKRLKETVDNSVQISFRADINDMSQHGYDYQHAVVGDRVFLVDERIGLNTEIRVVQISRTINANDELRGMEITFGTQPLSETYSGNFNNAMRDVMDLMAGRKALPFFALDKIAKSMVTKIQNASSEILFDENGLHAISKSNPNNILTLNSEGWYISTDGGSTAKTIATAEGFVADAITTGSLLTQLVTIVGREGYFYIDGDVFMAKDPNSLSKTEINPRGLNITRPDGAVYMVNGVPVLDLEIQKNPLRYHTVDFDGRVSITSESDSQYFEYFYTQRKARYITISYACGLDASSINESGEVEFLIQEFGNSESNRTVTERVPVTKLSESFGAITIDLGVPTYAPLQCYLKFRRVGGSTSDKVTIRSTRIHMRG
nr:phage tail protein [Mammaliicoccus sp. Marseille-Q6498]